MNKKKCYIRQGLTNVSIAAETTTEPRSAENRVIDQQLEAQEIAKDKHSCAGGENRLKKVRSAISSITQINIQTII